MLASVRSADPVLVRSRRTVIRRAAASAAALALLATGCSAAGPHDSSIDPSTLRYTGAARIVAPDFLGVNGEGITTDLLSQAWHSSRFGAAVSALHPGNIRIFGGTSANLWDWSSGQLAKSGPPGSGYEAGAPHPPIRLKDMTAVLRVSGATAVFDLNLVTSTLSDQLTMLRAARAAGVPVRRVELGNELWSPYYATRFPSGHAYALVANRWIAALHRQFPGVQVAVDVDTPAQQPNDRARAWNAQLLAAVNGADAVIVHQYLHTVANAPNAVVAAVGDAWQTSIQPTLSALPPDMPIWLTEWNYMPATPPAGTPRGAEAIGNALFALRTAGEPRIALADFHDLAGWHGSPFAAVVAEQDDTANALHFRLSPSGATLRPLLALFDGCAKVRPVGGAPAITGLACISAPHSRVVLVNASGRPRTVDLRGIDPGANARADTLVVDPLSTSNATPKSTTSEVALGRLPVPSWSVVLVSR